MTPLQQTAFENIVAEEEFAQNEQFLLLPQCFPLSIIGYPFNYKDFLFLTKYVQSRLFQNCHIRARVKSEGIMAKDKFFP